ncbi:hypothetical protein P2G74_01430 [Cronobacter muytjensii]|uniref:hypothetical protein n=1 Tax=Cronobacter muytjensii TaxID=413501 RepID=UPI002DB7A916|nr:hypothetical protein [Cronobacter muytjensii]MEB8638634.1 hypothetical protein [Cronobacter muytjensii]
MLQSQDEPNESLTTDDLLNLLRLPGRYLVYVPRAGAFTVTPVPVNAVVITPESHHQCADYFSRP